MTTKTITINVTNRSPAIQSFFIFQQPAIFSGETQVYSNSLYCQTLLPYSTSGTILNFSIVAQIYAGVGEQTSPLMVGQPSIALAGVQPVGLAQHGGVSIDDTTAISEGPMLELSAPVRGADVPPGSFRIITPTFDPALSSYNAGSAVQMVSGEVMLSSFVKAPPAANVDCQPVNIFYVQIGTYEAGTVLDFERSSFGAAICDSSAGFTTFNVAYNADGT
jgi:hypothetical protein